LLEAITQLALVFSLSGNVFLAISLRRLKEKPKQPVPDLTAQDLIHDLTRRGNATVRIEVVDASKFLLWRGE
jgi:hypothetical protein